jgi:hypothetical protein
LIISFSLTPYFAKLSIEEKIIYGFDEFTLEKKDPNLECSNRNTSLEFRKIEFFDSRSCSGAYILNLENLRVVSDFNITVTLLTNYRGGRLDQAYLEVGSYYSEGENYWEEPETNEKKPLASCSVIDTVIGSSGMVVVKGFPEDQDDQYTTESSDSLTGDNFIFTIRRLNESLFCEIQEEGNMETMINYSWNHMVSKSLNYIRLGFSVGRNTYSEYVRVRFSNFHAQMLVHQESSITKLNSFPFLERTLLFVIILVITVIIIFSGKSTS